MMYVNIKTITQLLASNEVFPYLPPLIKQPAVYTLFASNDAAFEDAARALNL